eukprot:3819751-Rhodomonas_salina.2
MVPMGKPSTLQPASRSRRLARAGKALRASQAGTCTQLSSTLISKSRSSRRQSAASLAAASASSRGPTRYTLSMYSTANTSEYKSMTTGCRAIEKSALAG